MGVMAWSSWRGMTPLSQSPRRLANLYENKKGFEEKIQKIVIAFNCLIFLPEPVAGKFMKISKVKNT
jgi:hypothetical protein